MRALSYGSLLLRGNQIVPFCDTSKHKVCVVTIYQYLYIDG